jgi:hypothetical protein
MTRRHLLPLIVIAAGVVLLSALTFEAVLAWAGSGSSTEPTPDTLGPAATGFGLIALGLALVGGVVAWGRREARTADPAPTTTAG